MEKKPRPHAELIKQWADGAEIEYRQKHSGTWTATTAPAFVEDYEYRVKPAREYPKLAAADVSKIAEYFCLQVGTIELVSQSVFRHALDNGQVVTREEFSRAIGERAARDLAVSMAVRDKCRDLTVKHAMRSGVVNDIERLDLFAIIDAVNG